MTFQIKSHGGFCCGMIHVHSIPTHSEASEARLKTICENYSVNQQIPPDQKMAAIEMVFTDQKLKNGWLEALGRLGFKRTIRWKNPNTGNFLNQFVLCLEAPPAGGYQQEK